MSKECLQCTAVEYFVAELEEIAGLKDLYFGVKKWSNTMHQSPMSSERDTTTSRKIQIYQATIFMHNLSNHDY
jgi:hypothetical protein